MSVECFIDTNLFLYQIENVDKRKSHIADQIIRKGIRTKNACISFQVVQECLNVLLRKAVVPLNPMEANRYFDSVLSPLWQVMPNHDLYHQGIEIQARYRFSFYDSLIIAASLSAGCRILYTEDMKHDQKIGKLTIHNPFRV